jgi:hypothetical protein
MSGREWRPSCVTCASFHGDAEVPEYCSVRSEEREPTDCCVAWLAGEEARIPASAARSAREWTPDEWMAQRTREAER